MSKPYTDEEYHAAWHAAYGSDTIGDRQVFPVEFRGIVDALDAVAPAIIRRAKAEALRDFADNTSAGDYGYGAEGSGWYERDAESILDAARSMADEIEAAK